jgi:elongator complex protein 3
LRLRLSSVLKQSIIPELKGNTAMIRELHVYGRVKEVGVKSEKSEAQHLGIGKLLLKKAEEISIRNGFSKIAVISGIGVRDYYRKRGYTLVGTYMVKKINNRKNTIIYLLLILMSILIGIYLY